MKSKAFLALLAMSIALMLPLMAAADEPDPLVLEVSGAGYHESVIDYEWDAEASVASGGTTLYAVDLMVGGHISMDYDLVVTRTADPAFIRHGFRGEVDIDNNTTDALPALQLLLKLFASEDGGDWLEIEQETIPLLIAASVTTTVPYDFEIDIDDFNATTQGDFEFKVVASAAPGATPYSGETEALIIPANATNVEVNRTAVIDADFVWLYMGAPVALPTGVTILTSPASQSWTLDTGNLINGAVTLDLLTVMGTLGYTGPTGSGLHGLRLDVSITPADSAVFVADTLLLPVSITVPAIGSHTVHFYVTGGHGSIVAKLVNSELVNGAIIAAGSQLNFFATPEAGYKVKEWKINNVVQAGTGLVLNIQSLAVNTVVTVEFAPVGAVPDDDEDDDDDNDDNGTPAATSIANKILKEHNIPHRIATTTLKKNGKATYINLISAVAKQNKGNTFMGVDRANQAAYYTAVYNYLKQLGAQLP